jgi:hypothetical protein
LLIVDATSGIELRLAQIYAERPGRRHHRLRLEPTQSGHPNLLRAGGEGAAFGAIIESREAD